MRRLLRPVLIVLAVIFLIEAWLWDHLEPIVARVVRLIPLARIKAAFAEWTAELSPSATLLLFLLPQVIIIPIKIFEFWLFLHEQWLYGFAMMVLSKLVFLGTAAFVFEVARDKLLQLDWLRGLYNYLIWLRDAAKALIDPIKQRIARKMRMFMPKTSRRTVRLMMRIRRRMQMQKAAT
jgi:hypothetical protein